MPEYLSPGVYIEEFEIGAKPIEGVSTSTAGFLGETERGPTTPCLITSWLQYQRVYGGYLEKDKYLPGSVDGFFRNGGKRCYIGRIVKAIPTKLGEPIATTASLTLKSDELKLKNDDNTLTVKAVGEGAWGVKTAVQLSKGSISGFKLHVFYWKTNPPISTDLTIDPAHPEKFSVWLKKNPSTVYEIFDNVSTTEKSPDYFEKVVNGISSLIKISFANEEEKKDAKDANPVKSTTEPVTDIFPVFLLEKGGDGNEPLIVGDYLRNRPEDDKPGNRKGLTAFEEIEDISIVYSPNAFTVKDLVGSLISHCEKFRRFAILDAIQGSSTIPDLDPRSNKPDGGSPTDYAAFYYPWIKVVNPETGMLQLMPPGGHVAGIYARSDTERGVHKAPANEIVQGASDLEFQIMKGEQDILNPRGVNVIRAFPGRGIRVWGARTISSNPLWKYINVRRLFIYVEESIEKGTQWVVFEPNDDRLWARVRATITQFLTGVWRSGALMGTTPEEAFFVKCDRSTMTQDDIDNGRLICIVGIAPVKPAEFVIFRIAQWQGGSAATE